MTTVSVQNRLETEMQRLPLARILLILANLFLLAIGITLIVRTATDQKATVVADALGNGGIDVEDLLHTLKKVAVGVGSAVCGIALMGTVGSLFKNRVILWIFTIVLIVLIAACVVGSAGAFKIARQMDSWNDSSFPSSSRETDLAKQYNQAYCYALGYYFCNDITVGEAVQILDPDLNATAMNVNVSQAHGLVSTCDYLTPLHISAVDAMCTECHKSSAFKVFDKLLTEIQTMCPRDVPTSVWCGKFLATGTAGDVYDKSPYKLCRRKVLNLAERIAMLLGSVALVGGIVTLIVLVITRCAARRHVQDNDLETSENAYDKDYVEASDGY